MLPFSPIIRIDSPVMNEWFWVNVTTFWEILLIPTEDLPTI